ncbi:MAG: hypothetical protein MI919_36625, partial [Holophagales bacterium]|nr:hypothetical protein [Holophagales bacterium]
MATDSPRDSSPHTGSPSTSSSSPPASNGSRFTALGSNLALSAISILVLLLVVEIALRITGFSFVLYPEDIEFGRPDPVMLEKAFLPDDDLFWVTRDYPAELTRLEQLRPPLLLLGDSCTHLGQWDDYLAELARNRFGQAPSWGNLAVAGWSSHQGRAQMVRDVPALEPAVITLYFGWNDHWIGFGVDDR